jgi:hypothetical protein
MEIQDRVHGAFLQDHIRLRHDSSMSVGVSFDWQNLVADPDAVASRLAFAFAPGNATKTVFRAGAGIFHQTTGAQTIAAVLRVNGHSASDRAVESSLSGLRHT